MSCVLWREKIFLFFPFLVLSANYTRTELVQNCLFFPFVFISLGAECGINAEAEKQLEMGKKLLAAGQLADALSHFHTAIGVYLKTAKLLYCMFG